MYNYNNRFTLSFTYKYSNDKFVGKMPAYFVYE